MTTHQTSYLSEILSDDPIPVGKRAYFAERLKNRLYDLIVSEFKKRGLSKADLARRTGRKPEQVTRWLGSPGNWTLDTISDLLIAMGSELDVGIAPLSGRPARNSFAPPWFYGEEELPSTTQKIRARMMNAAGTTTDVSSGSDSAAVRWTPT
jgi:DNA-binding phage protein